MEIENLITQILKGDHRYNETSRYVDDKKNALFAAVKEW